MSQQTIQGIQGILSERIAHQNEFKRIMGDIRIGLHPAAQDVEIIFNTKEYDHYKDVTHNREECRLVKRVLVTKNKVEAFVQSYFPNFLVEDDENMPYVVSMTVSDLPRPVQADDQIRIAGELYTVSKVKLTNRTQDSILYCLIYNERGNIEQYQKQSLFDDDVYSYRDGRIVDEDMIEDGNIWRASDDFKEGEEVDYES